MSSVQEHLLRTYSCSLDRRMSGVGFAAALSNLKRYRRMHKSMGMFLREYLTYGLK